MLLEYGKAFLVGGILCTLGQLLIDKTRLTPARILSAYVVAGVFLTAVGLYQPLTEWAGAGATVPLTGFGSLIAQGVRSALEEQGPIGILSGGFTAASAGIGGAVFCSWLVAVLFKPREKG